MVEFVFRYITLFELHILKLNTGVGDVKYSCIGCISDNVVFLHQFAEVIHVHKPGNCHVEYGAEKEEWCEYLH